MTEPVRLEPAQRNRAIETLTRAFKDDPVYAYICPDDTRRSELMRGLWDAAIRHALAYGEVWTTPEITGVACWLSPGNSKINFWQMFRTGFALPRAILRFDRDSLRRAMDLFGYTEGVHRRVLPGPHWYLWVLGVEPSRQGQGIGGKLLRPILDRADAADLPCYLETDSERNVAFYRRHGFEDIAVERAAAHPMLWAMVRPPRR